MRVNRPGASRVAKDGRPGRVGRGFALTGPTTEIDSPQLRGQRRLTADPAGSSPRAFPPTLVLGKDVGIEAWKIMGTWESDQVFQELAPKRWPLHNLSEVRQDLDELADELS